MPANLAIKFAGPIGFATPVRPSAKSVCQFQATTVWGVFGPVRPESAYFWTREWQEDEREADEDIRAGRVTRFDNADEGIQYLWDLISAEEEA